MKPIIVCFISLILVCVRSHFYLFHFLCNLSTAFEALYLGCVIFVSSTYLPVQPHLLPLLRSHCSYVKSPFLVLLHVHQLLCNLHSGSSRPLLSLSWRQRDKHLSIQYLSTLTLCRVVWIWSPCLAKFPVHHRGPVKQLKVHVSHQNRNISA